MDLSLPGTYGPWDPGGGPWIEEEGIREWFNDPSQAPKEQLTPEWRELFDWWLLVELDFQDWGIDLEECLDRKSWQWFKNRLSAIITNANSRTHRMLVAKRKEAGIEETT